LRTGTTTRSARSMPPHCCLLKSRVQLGCAQTASLPSLTAVGYAQLAWLLELPSQVGRGRWPKQFDQLLLGSHPKLAEDRGETVTYRALAQE